MKVVAGHRPVRDTWSNSTLEAFVNHVDGEAQPREAYLPKDCGLYVQWGYKKTIGLTDAMQKRIPFIILDAAYFRRHGDFSISINGFHGLSMEPEGMDEFPDRPRPVIEPWRDEPEEARVYVYNQLNGDRACRGMDMQAWARRAAQQAIAHFQLPVVIRPHPKDVNPWEPPLPPLEATFEDAMCVVTWTSTAGIEAAAAGVPVVAQHPASMAAPVASKMMSRVRWPGREKWAHDLACRQYRREEMSNAWNYVDRQLSKARREAEAGHYDTEGLRV